MSDNRDESGRLTKFVTKQGKGVLIARLWKTGPDGRRVYAEAWTLRKVRNGRQLYFTLPRERAKAEQVANEIDAFLQVRSNTVEQALAKFAPGKTGGTGDAVATVGETVDAYLKRRDVLDVKKSSAEQAVRGLLRIVWLARAQRAGRRGFYGTAMDEREKEAVRRTSLADVDHTMLTHFKSAVLAGVEDEVVKKSRKRTANGYLAGARSLFTDAARRVYRAAGLIVPELAALAAEPDFRKVDTRYRLPELRVINAMFDLGPRLRETDRNAYLAWLLALHAGLRKEEIGHCRRAWFSETAPWKIRVAADGEFNPKGHEGETEVEPWVHDEIVRLGGEDYVLTGHASERCDDVFRRLNPLLRAAGMDREKPTHELRKLFGSYIASTRGLFVAQKFLRHQSAQLTSDDYADAVLDELLRARWRAAG